MLSSVRCWIESIQFQLPPARPAPSASEWNCSFSEVQFANVEKPAATVVLWDMFLPAMREFLEQEMSPALQKCMLQYPKEIEALVVHS